MRSIEEEIRRAMEAGKFDNLPGKGKPLRLDDDTHTDPEWRTAYRMLKGAGYTLPWIEKRQEIERLLAKAREDLRRAWLARGVRPEVEWERGVTLFKERLAALNRQIFSYNLEAPNSQVQMTPLRWEAELARLQGPD